MTPSVTEVPQELRELPQAVLDAIYTACAGDWRRVVVEGPGQWIVHNQPQFRRVQLPDVRPRGNRVHHRRVAPRVVARDHGQVVLPAGMEAMGVARVLAEFMAAGIDTDVEIAFAEHLLELNPSLVDLAVAACRHPRSVEVASETTAKGPRLLFQRGDVSVVLAFEKVTQPLVIAVHSTAA